MLFDRPAVWTRRSIPWRAMKSCAPNEAAMTPIDPKTEAGSIQISSACTASQ